MIPNGLYTLIENSCDLLYECHLLTSFLDILWCPENTVSLCCHKNLFLLSMCLSRTEQHHCGNLNIFWNLNILFCVTTRDARLSESIHSGRKGVRGLESASSINPSHHSTTNIVRVHMYLHLISRVLMTLMTTNQRFY